MRIILSIILSIKTKINVWMDNMQIINVLNTRWVPESNSKMYFGIKIENG